MRELFGYLKPNFPKMCFGLVIKFFGTIMDLFLPWVLAYMIDNVAVNKDIKMIVIWGFVMVLAAVFAVLSNVYANRLAAAVARDTTRKLRHDLFEKISYLSCREIDRFTIPSLETRMTTDTYNVHHTIGMAQRIGVRAPILFIGGICITMTLEPVLTLVLIGALPIMFLVVYAVTKKGVTLFEKQQKCIDELVRVVRENITGIRVIKALSKTEYEKERFDKTNAEVVATEKKASLTMAITNPFMSLILNVGLAIVLIIGAFRVNSGVTGTGTIIAFLSYFTIILNALLVITRIFTNITKGIASMKRISEVLHAENEQKILKEYSLGESEYHIEFKNVSFSYYNKINNIENISFALRRGESLGIIGSTGSGKTTLAAVLMRLYDCNEGQILIDGRDVKTIDGSELYNMFGVVFQADSIFADTIRNNIDFERGLTDEQIFKAIEISQAKEFVSSIKEGLDYKVTSKGTNLSGGQRQRLLIARAVAANPEILIFDDSSSALDYKTDALLREEIRENLGGVTSVIIAQRVSSIKNCTYICMIEEGKIIGFGRHSELMEKCSAYKQIAELQLGGGQNG